MLRIVQKKTKRSFALRLVGVLWTESRVCRSFAATPQACSDLKSAASVTSPSCGVKRCPRSCAPGLTANA